MPTLKVNLFLPFAQFRNPYTFFYAQTFPLPPKSQVVGMLQNLTGDYYHEEYWNLKIAIFGLHESFFWNYQQLIKGMPKPKEKVMQREATGKRGGTKKVKEMHYDYSTLIAGKDKLPLYGAPKRSQRTPTYQQEIYNLRVTLFIQHEDETFIRKLESAFWPTRKVMHLGRSEDIYFVRQKPSLITFERKELKDFTPTFGTYLKKEDGRHLENETHFPVYSIPLKSTFQLGGVPIKNHAELLNNKDKVEREVSWQTVYYVEGNRLILPKRQEVEVHRTDIEGHPIKYYLTQQSWL